MFFGSLALLTLNGCLMRASPDHAPLVGSVNFRGNVHLTSDEIRSKIALTKSGRHIIFDIGSAYTFERGSLKVDAERIVRLYQAHGYYDAKVTDIETRLDRGRINVTFTINEGVPVRITSIDVKGLEQVWPQTRQFVTRRLPLHVGDVFAEAPYEQEKAVITDRLRNNAYLKAKTDGVVDINTKTHRAAVHLSVEPGLQYHVGRIKVEGVLGTRGHNDIAHGRILDASHFKKGELLTPKAIDFARDQISNMGVFTSVDIQPDLVTQEAPINIVVREAPFQTIEAGAGLEIDQTRQLGRLSLTYTNKNLGRDLQHLVAGGSLGYAFLPSVFNIQEQGIIGDAQLQYIQPRIFRKSIDFQVTLDYTKDLIPAVHYQRIGLRPGLLMYLDSVKGLSFAPSINYEYYFNVGVGPSGNPNSVVGGVSPLQTTGCSPSANGASPSTCLIGYIEGLLTYDLRDNPVEPHKGAFFSFDIQYAGLPFSNFRYIRYSPEIRGYVPLPWSRRFVLAARGRFGYLQDLQGNDPNLRSPPIMSHFLAGGANSVRAAGTQLLGPLTFEVEDNTGSSRSMFPYEAAVPIPIGGDHLVEGSLELRWFTPVKDLGIVLFFDAGRVWTTNPKDFGYQQDMPGYQYGPGIGIRYRTPLGPLRLDIAYRVSRYTTHPVNVDTSLVLSPPAGAPPPSTNPLDYTISTDCPAHSPTPWQCYSVPRINFYLTIGEAF